MAKSAKTAMPAMAGRRSKPSGERRRRYSRTGTAATASVASERQVSVKGDTVMRVLETAGTPCRKCPACAPQTE
jgi:hypothetical protein